MQCEYLSLCLLIAILVNEYRPEFVFCIKKISYLVICQYTSLFIKTVIVNRHMNKMHTQLVTIKETINRDQITYRSFLILLKDIFNQQKKH